MTALLLALMASAPPVFFLPPDLPREVQRQLLDDIYSDTTVDPVLLSFMPADGAGVVAGQKTMCPWLQAGGYLSGNYTCLDGNGTSLASSGMELEAVGSPAETDSPTCSNGFDCTARTSQRLGAGSYFRANGVSNSTVDTSACAGFIVDTNVPAAQELVFMEDVSFGLRVSGSSVNVYGGSGGNTAVIAGVQNGALHVACGTYNPVTSGTSILRVYLDGVAGGTNTTATIATSGATNLIVGNRNSGAVQNPFVGRLLFAFKTDKLLSTSEVTAIARAALGTLAGTKGEVLTFSRNTVSTCCRDDGSGCVVLAPNRACIAGGKLKVRPVVANLLAQTDALDNATWIKAASTVAADAALAPNGTMTADAMVEDLANAQHFVYQNYSATAGTTYTYSRWVKAAGRTKANVAVQLFSARVDLTTCAISFLGGTPTPTATVSGPDALGGCRVSLTFTEQATATRYVTVWPLDDANNSTYLADGRVALYLAEAQLTQTAAALDYCPTGAAPASCAGEQYAWAKPNGMSGAEGCSRFCLTPSWGGAAPAGTFLGFATAARWAYPVTTSLRMTDGTTSTILTPVGYTDGVQQCFRSEWSVAGNFQRLVRESDNASATSAFSGYATQPTFGNLSATTMPFSISQVKVGNAPGACTP